MHNEPEQCDMRWVHGSGRTEVHKSGEGSGVQSGSDNDKTMRNGKRRKRNAGRNVCRRLSEQLQLGNVHRRVQGMHGSKTYKRAAMREHELQQRDKDGNVQPRHGVMGNRRMEHVRVGRSMQLRSKRSGKRGMYGSGDRVQTMQQQLRVGVRVRREELQ